MSYFCETLLYCCSTRLFEQDAALSALTPRYDEVLRTVCGGDIGRTMPISGGILLARLSGSLLSLCEGGRPRTPGQEAGCFGGKYSLPCQIPGHEGRAHPRQCRAALGD